MYQGWAYPMPPTCEVRAASAITKFKDELRDYGWGFMVEDLGVCYHYRRTRVVPFMILLQHTAGLGTSKIKVTARNILQSKKRGLCSPETPLYVACVRPIHLRHFSAPTTLNPRWSVVSFSFPFCTRTSRSSKPIFWIAGADRGPAAMHKKSTVPLST